MTRTTSSLALVLLLVVSFTLATVLQPRALDLRGRGQSTDILKIVLGDGRRMFANHFFVKADVYFHSGYYPSIFEQSYQELSRTSHLAEEQHEDHHDQDGHEDHDEHEKGTDFLGKPVDWIDRFGRHFYSSKHSHLDKPGAVREILPWLSLSAELDPTRIETFTVAAYWLRLRLNKVNEAEEFLRVGLRANPTSYEILFELGKLYNENRKDPVLAANLFELALRRWNEQDEAGKDPDIAVYDQIMANIVDVEEKQGNLRAALFYLEEELMCAPLPQAIQDRIDELNAKLAADASGKPGSAQ